MAVHRIAVEPPERMPAMRPDRVSHVGPRTPVGTAFAIGLAADAILHSASVR
jgi:hypothetical protein